MKLYPCPKCAAKGPLTTMAQKDDLFCSVKDGTGNEHGAWTL